MNCPRCNGKVEVTLEGCSKIVAVEVKPSNPPVSMFSESKNVAAGVHVVYECECCELYIHWHKDRGITVEEWHPKKRVEE